MRKSILAALGLTACSAGPTQFERCVNAGGAYAISGYHTAYRNQLIGKVNMLVPYTVTDYACFEKGERMETQP